MITLKNINKTYHTGTTSLHVLKGVDLHIKKGSLYPLWDRQVLENQLCSILLAFWMITIKANII